MENDQKSARPLSNITKKIVGAINFKKSFFLHFEKRVPHFFAF